MDGIVYRMKERTIQGVRPVNFHSAGPMIMPVVVALLLHTAVFAESKNNPVLSLPIANEKLVIAHSMTKTLPGLTGTFTMNKYLPTGDYSNIGGFNLVFPISGFFGGVNGTGLASAASKKTMDAGAQLALDRIVEREMRTALYFGIDGFDMYYPGGEESEGELNLYHNVIESYLRVAEEKDLKFRIALSLGNYRIQGGTERTIDVMAKKLKLLFEKTASSKKWLRTPDGRLIFFTFGTLKIVSGISDASVVLRDSAAAEVKMKSVADAYDTLFQRIGVRGAIVFHLDGIYNLTRKMKGNKIDPPAGELDFPLYERYVSLILDYFPAITGFECMETAENLLAWGRVTELCRERNRTCVLRVFPGGTMSKVWSVSKNERELDLNEIKQGFEDLRRIEMPSRLSSTFRSLWGVAISNDVQMVGIVSWDDYEEGHHLAPEINHNFGFGILMKYFKASWKKEPLHFPDQAVVFYKKYRSEIQPLLFPIAIGRPQWMIGEKEWSDLLASDDAVEIVTALKEPGVLFFRGRKIGDVPAGLNYVMLPLSPGPVSVRVERSGKPIVELHSPEWITDRPYRSDRTTFVWESEHDNIFKTIFPGETNVSWNEYSQGADGVANWKKLYPTLGGKE